MVCNSQRYPQVGLPYDRELDELWCEAKAGFTAGPARRLEILSKVIKIEAVRRGTWRTKYRTAKAVVVSRL